MSAVGVYGPEVVLNGSVPGAIVLANTQITVKNLDGTAATCYTDATGTTTTSNVTATDSEARLTFYAAPGPFLLSYTSGVGTESVRVEVPLTASVAGGTYQKLTAVPVNVLSPAYGADPTGAAYSDAAFAAAWAVRGAIKIPAGTYKFHGTAPLAGGFANPIIVGDGAAVSVITLDAGGFLLDEPAQAWLSLVITDVQVSGGSGAVRNRFNGVNVNQRKLVARNIFTGYTGCALSSNASNEPYWSVRENVFAAANSTSSIGVALAGQADNCIVRDNEFTGNRIDVKMRQPATVRIEDNDFIPFLAAGANPRARVWLVPNATLIGGAVIDANKFGNETIAAGDMHILFADEAAAGTYVGDKQPVLNAASTNPISELFIGASNRFTGNATAAPPAVFSQTNLIEGGTIAGRLEGNLPTYMVQFYAPSTGTSNDRLSEATVIGPISCTTEGVLPLMSNANGAFGRPADDGYLLGHDPKSPMPGLSDAADFASLLSAAISTYSGGLAQVAITDALGGSDAATITYTSGAQAYHYPAVQPTVGRPIWIEFDAQSGGGAPLTSIEVQASYDTWGSGGPIFFRRFVPLSATWTRFRFPLTISATSASAFFTFISPNAGTVNLGRIRVYHGRAPVPSDGLVFANGARWFTVTGVPPAGLGSNGDLAVRIDTPGTANQRLYMKAAGAWTALAV